MADSLPGQVDLERGRAAGIGQRAVGEECAAPDGGEFVARAGREPVREAADGAAACIQQSGLAREGLAAVENADEVLAGAAQAGRGDDRDFAAHAVELCEVFAHPTGELRGVEFALDGDAAARSGAGRRRTGGWSRVQPRGPWSC